MDQSLTIGKFFSPGRRSDIQAINTGYQSMNNLLGAQDEHNRDLIRNSRHRPIGRKIKKSPFKMKEEYSRKRTKNICPRKSYDNFKSIDKRDTAKGKKELGHYNRTALYLHKL